MTECVQQLRQRITQCEYNILDHYIIEDLRDERIRSKICCNQWLKIECIVKEAIDISECGPKERETTQDTHQTI
jgi:hypothetical protein